jgi:hypothetical protein
LGQRAAEPRPPLPAARCLQVGAAAATVATAKGAEDAAALAALAAAEGAAVAAVADEVRLEGLDLLRGAAAKPGGPQSPGPPPGRPEHEAAAAEDEEDVPPPPPPAAAPAGGGEGDVPWQMVFRAAGAADVGSITELQAADSNALLRELAARLLPAEPELQVGRPAAAGGCRATPLLAGWPA